MAERYGEMSGRERVLRDFIEDCDKRLSHFEHRAHQGGSNLWGKINIKVERYCRDFFSKRLSEEISKKYSTQQLNVEGDK